MCPVCITTAVLIAGSVASTGVLAAARLRRTSDRVRNGKTMNGEQSDDDARDRDT